MSPRALTIALIVSLVVNVFVIGAVAGAIGMRQRMIEERMRPPIGNPLMRAGERLPDEVRARYLARMRTEGAANRAKLTEARRARSDAVRALSAVNYEPKVAADALARARAAEEATRASLENAVVDFSRNLKPEERRILAKGLRQPSGPRGDGRRGRDGRGRPYRPDGMGPPGPPMGPPPGGGGPQPEDQKAG